LAIKPEEESMNRGFAKYIMLAASIALSCALALNACTPRPRVTSSPPAGKEEPYDFTKEGKIPPAKEGDITKETDIEEIPVTSDTVHYEEMPPQVDSSFVVTKEIPKEPVMQEGFRVQVFASNSSIAAQEMKDRMAREFATPAYVTPVDDMYKVRIGDFTSRQAAELFLARCKAAGYKDAWIVETLVRVQPETPSETQ
jgi:hypothetical protein